MEKKEPKSPLEELFMSLKVGQGVIIFIGTE